MLVLPVIAPEPVRNSVPALTAVLPVYVSAAVKVMEAALFLVKPPDPLITPSSSTVVAAVLKTFTFPPASVTGPFSTHAEPSFCKVEPPLNTSVCPKATNPVKSTSNVALVSTVMTWLALPAQDELSVRVDVWMAKVPLWMSMFPKRSSTVAFTSAIMFVPATVRFQGLPSLLARLPLRMSQRFTEPNFASACK